MKRFKRIGALILCAALFLSTTACYGDTTWVVKTDTQSIPAGVYISYVIDEYNNATNKVDSSKDVWSQQVEGKSVEQWVMDQAVERCRQYVAVNMLFDQLGMTMDDAANKTVKNTADNSWSQNQESYDKHGISYTSVKKLAEYTYKRAKVFDYYFETNGVEPTSEETIKSYFYDNYAKVKLLSVSRKDLTTGTAIADATLKEEVQGYVTRINQGEDMDTIIDEYTTNMYKAYGLSSYAPDTTDAARNVTLMEKGQTGVFENLSKLTFEQNTFGVPYVDDTSSTTYVYIAVRYDITKDPTIYDTDRSTVLQVIRGDAFAAKLNDAIKSVKFSINDSAVSRYSPKTFQS